MISNRVGENLPTPYILEKDYTVDLDENGSYDAIRQLFDNGDYIVKNAIAAAKEAKHYGGTNVGVCALDSNLEENRWKIFRGFNVKLDPSIPTVCAEMAAWGTSLNAGYSQYDGLIVAGSSDPNRIAHINGLAAPTLHPCYRCRPKLEDETVVITIAAQSGVLEAHTGEQINKLYDSLANFNKKQSRAKRRESFEYHDRSVEIPDAAGWAGMLVSYNTLVSSIDPEKVKNIRLVRAQKAVAVITHREFESTALRVV